MCPIFFATKKPKLHAASRGFNIPLNRNSSAEAALEKRHTYGRKNFSTIFMMKSFNFEVIFQVSEQNTTTPCVGTGMAPK